VASLRNEVGPAFSFDGNTLAFVTDRWGQFSIGLQDIADGVVSGPPRRLTDHPGSCSHPTFSPDGKWIAYYRVLEARRDIWIVPASGGIPVRVTEDEAQDYHPAWSPDGTRIAFVSDRSGRGQVWLLPVGEGRRAGPPEQLTFGETSDSDPTWSRDGKWIAYAGEIGDATEVWIVPADGSAAPRVLTDGAQAEQIAWHAVEPRLMVSGQWGNGVFSVRSVPLDGTTPSPIEPPVSFGTAALRGSFDVTGDGALIAFVEQATSGDIWVLETDAGAY
jgi:TolB protein